MLKQVFTWALCFVVVASAFSADALAIQSTDRPAQRHKIVHLNQLIETLGCGEDALIAVRLRDKSVVSGYVADIGTDSFAIANPNTGTSTTVEYAEVSRLQGFNLATGTEVHHGLGLRGKLLRIAGWVVPGQRVQRNNLSRTETVLIVGIIIGIIVAIVVAKTV